MGMPFSPNGQSSALKVDARGASFLNRDREAFRCHGRSALVPSLGFVRYQKTKKCLVFSQLCSLQIGAIRGMSDCMIKGN